MNWPKNELIKTERLSLEPLTVEHAVEMVEVLADVSLYQFTGGEPPALDQLRGRYQRQAVGHSADMLQGWLNWIVRSTSEGVAMGFVQATLERVDGALVADIAWVISPARQGQGVASEAAAAMAGWLRSQGVDCLVAYIHPEHDASIGVARRLGLQPTSLVEDGEVRWESR